MPGFSKAALGVLMGGHAATPAWTTLYNAASTSTWKTLLYADESFMTVGGGDCTAWACSLGSGYDASEAVKPPSWDGTKLTFDGTEYMDWDCTGMGITGNVTYALGINVNAASGANDLFVAANVGRGPRNASNNWNVWDNVTSIDTGVSLDFGNLHSVVIQCTNGAPVKCWVDGVLAGTSAANYTAYAFTNVLCIMAKTSHANINVGDLYWVGILDGADDTDSAAISLEGKDILGV